MSFKDIASSRLPSEKMKFAAMNASSSSSSVLRSMSA